MEKKKRTIPKRWIKDLIADEKEEDIIGERRNAVRIGRWPKWIFTINDLLRR